MLFSLSLFGILFSLILFGSYKMQFFFPGDYGTGIASRKISYFPLISFFVLTFLALAAFQYINTAGYALRMNEWANDMTRYKVTFDDAAKYSLRAYLKAKREEPLYLSWMYFLRKITGHFSIVLLFSYSFVVFSMMFFLRRFVKNVSLIFPLSFFSIYYSFIIVSFCLFRMGLAVSFVLFSYVFLSERKYFKSIFFTLTAMGFHLSAAFFIFAIVLHKIFVSPKISFSLFLFLFFASFVAIFVFGKIVVSWMNHSGKYASYGSGGGMARNTYLTNFLFLILVLYKRKKFFSGSTDSVCFVVLLAGFYIMVLQSLLSIFYRMIMFTYPCMVFLVPKIWCAYKIRRNDFFVPVCVRFFLLFYLIFFYYKFCADSWFGYGLNSYDIFFFY